MEEVIEQCPHCGNEADILWDKECDGYVAYCPYCGELMMLCSECPATLSDCTCDWNRTNECQIARECLDKMHDGGKLKRSLEVRQIADHYGKAVILQQLVEEMAELTQAICKVFRGNGRGSPIHGKTRQEVMDSLKEETADVQFCLDELKYLFGYLFEDGVNDCYTKKVTRQTARIEMEKGDENG